MGTPNADRRVLTALVLGVVALLLAAGCGTRVTDKFAALRVGSLTSSVPPTSATTATTLDAAAAQAEITANWGTFFSAQTPLAARQALLEDGSRYERALVARSGDPLQAEASAKVKTVELTAANRATVTYDVLLNGQTALPGATGVAVLQGGVWKVSAQSFCGLITLGATGTIPGCS